MNLFFKNGCNALLTRDYVSAIQRLASDPELRRTSAENAERDMLVYSWQEIAAQFNSYLAGVANHD